MSNSKHTHTQPPEGPRWHLFKRISQSQYLCNNCRSESYSGLRLVEGDFVCTNCLTFTRERNRRAYLDNGGRR